MALDDSQHLDHLVEFSLGAPLPISHWSLWLFLSLTRHRQRQQFVAEIVKFRLNGEPETIGKAGSFGHPDGPGQGLVPGMSEWEFYFHGKGCCLTHRGTGESIDVDFFDDTADWFDIYFYKNYLESMNSPELFERRVIELHPTLDTIALARDDLKHIGLLEKHPDYGVTKLSNPIESLSNRLDELLELLPQKKS